MISWIIVIIEIITITIVVITTKEFHADFKVFEEGLVFDKKIVKIHTTI